VGGKGNKKVSVKDAYFSDVSSVVNAGKGLSEVRDGLGSVDGSLKVTNVTDSDRLYDLYSKITNALDKYGEMLLHEAANLRQAGKNQQITDQAFGGH
jgi:hypothetical protein